MTASKLWRTFGLTEGLFVLTVGDELLRDRDIVSITHTRGNGAPAGLTVSTIEVTVKGQLPAIGTTKAHAYLAFTAAGKAAIDALCPAAWDGYAPSVAPRWRGRLASQSVEDTYRDPSRTTTHIQGTEWLALINEMNTGAVVTRMQPEAVHLQASLVTRMKVGLPGITPQGMSGASRFFPDDGPDHALVDTGEALDKYTTRMGTLIRTTRAGEAQAVTIDYLRGFATDWRFYNPVPVRRSHVLSPNKWVQPVTVPKRVAWTWRRTATAQTTTYSTSRETAFPDAGGTWPTEEIDMSNVVVDATGEDQLNWAMEAYAARTGPGAYRLERVNIDVLYLMRRNQPGDRAMVGQLLRLEPGDAVALSHDWPDGLAGVCHATQIIDRITASSWICELTLIPTEQVCGQPSPDVTVNTWDTTPPATTWDNIPATTWDNA